MDSMLLFVLAAYPWIIKLLCLTLMIVLYYQTGAQNASSRGMTTEAAVSPLSACQSQELLQNSGSWVCEKPPSRLRNLCRNWWRFRVRPPPWHWKLAYSVPLSIIDTGAWNSAYQYEDGELSHMSRICWSTTLAIALLDWHWIAEETAARNSAPSLPGPSLVLIFSKRSVVG